RPDVTRHRSLLASVLITVRKAVILAYPPGSTQGTGPPPERAPATASEGTGLDPAGDGSGLAARALPSPRPLATHRAWEAARWGPLGGLRSPGGVVPVPSHPPTATRTGRPRRPIARVGEVTPT